MGAISQQHREGMEEFARLWQENYEARGTETDFRVLIGNKSRAAMYRRRRRVEAHLGITLPTFYLGEQKVLSSFQALRGISPEHDMTHAVPAPFYLKGTSTLYTQGEDGKEKIASQWVKTALDPVARERMLIEAREAFAAEIPRVRASKPPSLVGPPELLNQYTITDYHLGMLAWGEETGEDWDIKIAESLLVGWFERAIAAAPEAETAIFAQMGDFLHWDGLEAVTPMHRNILDADTRFQKLVRVTIRVLRRVIAILLTKHARVHCVFAEGNHDPASSIWIREAFAAYYEDEPRVEVDLSPDPYYAYEHGKTAIFFHHGHLRKVQTVDSVLAGKFPQLYGRSEYRYAHTGHRHSSEIIETNLMLVEQHRTLAAKDAYANRGGWMSGRDAQVITYHTEYGEVGRVRISPKMIQGLSHTHKRKVHKTPVKGKTRRDHDRLPG